MDNNIKVLLEKFDKINKKGWIEGVNKSPSSVGLTFERELDKKIDTLSEPDFEDIEIKCTQRYSNFPITLLSKIFDGPRKYETNHIYLKYIEQYITGEYTYINLYNNKKILYKNAYYFELNVDKKENKIFLKIYNINNKLIDISYIEFDNILKYIERKLKKLVVVEASKDSRDDTNYYRYYKITYYKLKSLEKFIYLLENRYINILMIAKKRNENEIYRTLTKNRKIQFQLDKDKIDYLFSKVFEYDADQELLVLNTKEVTFNG